jgi:hypothetical protein
MGCDSGLLREANAAPHDGAGSFGADSEALANSGDIPYNITSHTQAGNTPCTPYPRTSIAHT